MIFMDIHVGGKIPDDFKLDVWNGSQRCTEELCWRDATGLNCSKEQLPSHEPTAYLSQNTPRKPRITHDMLHQFD